MRLKAKLAHYVGLFLLLTACGQRGALYLPDHHSGASKDAQIHKNAKLGQ